ARIQVRQYRSWLQIDQPQDGVSYYGQCRGDQLQLDVYQNGQFVGYQDGTVGGNNLWNSGRNGGSNGGWNGAWGRPPGSGARPWNSPDWSGPRPRFGRDWDDGRPRFVSGSWVMFAPNYAT